MTVAFIFFVVIITTLLAIIFVVLINYKLIKSGISNLSFKNVAVQLIALTIWLTLLGKLLIPVENEHKLAGFIIFATSIVIGILLIHNLSRESKTRRQVNDLIKKLDENNKRLRVLDQQKTEFVSLASHQLRGPLSVIQGYISMILEGDYGKVPEKIEDPLNKVFRSGATLGFLINDYLDVSRIEKGEMEYVLEKIDLVDMLMNITKEFKVSTDEAGLKLSYKNSAEEKLYVKADKTKIRQIISNLIDNSIKYTPSGGITVESDLVAGRARIKITDTGIGMDHMDIQKAFNKFERNKRAAELNVTGTGLGLFVAKVMTEAQNGKIWVESAGKNKGSTFFVEFPLTK